MMKSALSNKNINSIREMTKKLIVSSSSMSLLFLSSFSASKNPNPLSTTKQLDTKDEKVQNGKMEAGEMKKKANVTTFGTRKIGQKRACNPTAGVDLPPIKSQKRGMLAFSEDSDSDCL